MRISSARIPFVVAALVASACASDAGAPEHTLGTATSQAMRPTTPVATPTSPAPAPPTAAASFEATATRAPSGTAPSVTISAVGDISLARQVNGWMTQYGAEYPYALVLPVLSGDIIFGNLEGALTDGGEPWPKAFNFRTPPQYASGLAAAGFDIVSLANNHAMDFGRTGLLDTETALDAANVRHAGSGGDGVSARRATVIDSRGLRTAFVACVRTPAEGSGFTITAWGAGEGPGLFVCSQSEIQLAVEEARAGGADFVLVSIHAGDEYVNTPNVVQGELADAALAAGADVVLGHHAHVVQPVEQRGNQLIVWGMGNFIFDLDQWDLAGIPEPRVAPVVHITLTKGFGVTAWSADAVVLDAEQDRPRPATAEEAAVLDALLAP